MTCASCVNTIESFVGAQEGVHKVRVALLTEKAEVEFDEGGVKEAIETVGYEAEIIVQATDGTVNLVIQGLTCESDAAGIVDLLKQEAGVLDASINATTGMARVRAALSLVTTNKRTLLLHALIFLACVTVGGRSGTIRLRRPRGQGGDRFDRTGWSLHRPTCCTGYQHRVAAKEKRDQGLVDFPPHIAKKKHEPSPHPSQKKQKTGEERF